MKKVIVGLAGEIAAGKGTTADYLQKKHQAGTYRFSTALREVARRMYLDESRENLQKISTLFRENFDDNLLSAVIARDVEKDSRPILAVDGVRRLADIEYLNKLPGFCLVYIDTAMEKRFERIVQRGENSDDADKTFQQFKKDHLREAERQIKDLKEKADFIVDNNGLLEDLYRQIDEIIKKALEKG